MKHRFSQISSVFTALSVLLMVAPSWAQEAAPQTQDKAPVAEVAVPETRNDSDTLLRQGSEGHGESDPTGAQAQPQARAPESPAPAPAQEAASVEAPAPESAPTAVLEAPTPAPATANGPDTASTPLSPGRSDPTVNQVPAEPQWIYRGEVVVIGNDVLIRENERASQVVAIGGDVEVRGRVDGEVVAIGGDVKISGPVDKLVAIGGDVTMTGSVHGEMVAVGGDLAIDGPVGKLVAVFGDVTLGEKAVVNGEAVTVLGDIDNPHKVPIRGQAVEIGGFIPHPKFSALMAWGRDVVCHVRLLSPGLAWPWYVFGGCTLFYLLLAAVFGRGVNACARVLEESPGATLVTAIVLLPLLPLFVLLLVLTGVGVLLLPFLAVAVLFAGAFGKTAVLAFLGRSVLRPFGAESEAERTWLTVLIGAVLLALLYCVPVVGFLVWGLTAWVGFGMVVAALLQNRRREKARIVAQRQAASVAATAAAAVAPEAPMMTAAAEAPVPDEAAGASVPPVMPKVPPLLATPGIALDVTTLPRADFWLRLGALLIDIALVFFGSLFFGLSFLFVWLFGAYAFGFWLWKGTTIGGIVFNLKVVRLDGRPIDGATSAVRTVIAFLSAVTLLGFLWCLWDPEGQTWHDKVAGTVVVRVPKSTPLV